MVKVSVIIPVYNTEQYIGGAIESVLAQTFTDYEIIVINDGSTDNSESEILKYQDRIIYIKFSRNKGRGAARNAGLKRARGEYIAFLDADDEWLSEKLAAQVAYLDSRPDVGLAYTDAAIINAQGEYLGNNLRNLIAYEGEVFPYLMRANFMYTSGLILRQACLTRVGKFDVGIKRAQDYDLLLRIALFYKIGFIPGTLVKYRGDSWSLAETRLDSYRGRIKIFKKLERNYPKEIKKFGWLFDLSYSYIYQAIGREYLITNNFSQAALYYRKSTKHFPESLPLQEAAAINSYLAGQIRMAKKIINKILKGNLFNYRMLYYLGCCFFKEGKWKKAQENFQMAIKSMPYNPLFPEALNNLGLTYVAQGELSQAAFWLWSALNQKPDYQDAAFNQKLAREKVADISQYRFTRKQFGSVV